MYKQYIQAMYLTVDGWQTLRDDLGQKVELPNPTYGRVVAEGLKRQDGVLDAMLVKVEVSDVFRIGTREPMTHTTYTGLV